MSDAKWVATLSDGSTAVEGSNEYSQVPGERKPWVKLADHLQAADLNLTSLRLNLNGRTIHLPRGNFDRFNIGEIASAPSFYSLSYLHEAEMDEAGLTSTEYVDLTAHFNEFEVHYIQDLTDTNNSWVVVSEGYAPLAPTPRR